jgi:hypothetical protein
VITKAIRLNEIIREIQNRGDEGYIRNPQFGEQKARKNHQKEVATRGNNTRDTIAVQIKKRVLRQGGQILITVS